MYSAGHHWHGLVQAGPKTLAGQKHSYGRKKDPFFEAGSGTSNSFPALQDINFQIKQGETWGIVGLQRRGISPRLLKIISRITQPTTGYVRGRGTIGSLLEVGMGFHPELSGPEEYLY